MLQELTMEEVAAVSGVLSAGGAAAIALGGAALVAGGVAVGFGIAGAAGIIGIDAAFAGSMGFGVISLGLGGGGLVASPVDEF